MIHRHAVPAQINAQAGIAGDGVGPDAVPGRGGVRDRYPRPPVEGDQVPQDRGAADLVGPGDDPGGAVPCDDVALRGVAHVRAVDADAVEAGAEDVHAGATVAPGDRAAHVGADEVAGHHVPVGPGVGDDHADAGVAGDEVALEGVIDAVAVGADAVARRGEVDQHAVTPVREGL
jgi:hypothetical protein